MAKKWWALIAAVLAAAAIAAWYFLYYVKTPAYTVQLLQKAAAAHDTAAFEKHLDLRSVLDGGYDALMTAGLPESAAGDEARKAELQQIARAVKPAVVEQMREYILHAVAGGHWDTEKEGGTAQLEAIAERAGITAFLTKDVKTSAESGDRASLVIDVTHPDLAEPFPITADLSRLPDGTWQIRSLSNFGDFLTQLRAAQKEALRTYIAATKPMVDEANTKRQALTAGEPAITEDFAGRYNGLIDELEANLKTVDVPHGAKEFADFRLKTYDLMKEHMALIAKVQAGKGVPQDGQKIRAQQAQLAAMTRQLRLMEESAAAE